MARTERSAKRTTDHEEIRRWVEAHGGHPAAVKGTGRGGDPGILRIDFPGFTGEGKLEPIGWERFFEWFDKNELAFLHQDVENSRFNKIVSRTRRDEGRVSGQKRQASQKDGERQQAAVGVDAIHLLEQQHREVDALFEEYESAGDKRKIFDELADVLAAHSEIEERIFYPSVLADKTEEELREAVEEHLAIKRLIADLLAMKPDDEQFDSKIQVMRELVDHHVEEEENKLFSMVETLGPDTLRSLGEMMITAYDELMREEPRKKVLQQTGSASPLS